MGGEAVRVGRGGCERWKAVRNVRRADRTFFLSLPETGGLSERGNIWSAQQTNCPRCDL